LLIFQVLDLLEDAFEDGIGRDVVELSQGCMDALWILKVHVCIPVGLIEPFWLAIVDDLLDFGRIYLDLRCLWSKLLLSNDLVVEETLLAIDLASQVSRLFELLHQPLHDWQDVLEIITRNLMWEYLEWTLHGDERCYHLLSNLNLLTARKIILKLQINIEVASSDGPAHTSQDLVESINIESSTEVARRDQHITDLLELSRGSTVLYANL
jgi:hypothetical protein